MSALSSDFTGCDIMIYDSLGNILCNTVVTQYDRNALRIDVEDTPQSLVVGSVCKLLIMSSPAPCEYEGRIVVTGIKKSIAMFHGQVKENRAAVRYKANFKAYIENLIIGARACPLYSPLEITCINISKSGIRFKAPPYALSDGDRFQMRMKISGSEKLLIADVVSHLDKDPETSEYGCRFLIGSERVV